MNLQPRCSPDQGTELKNQGMVTRKSGMSNTGIDMPLLVGQDVWMSPVSLVYHTIVTWDWSQKCI